MYRKIVAYHFLIIFLLCSFQIGVKSHYCGGKYIGSKLVSGDGEISCGMKPQPDFSCEGEQRIKKKCCENFLAKFEFQDDFNRSVFLFNHTKYVAIKDLSLPLLIAYTSIFPSHHQNYAANNPPDLFGLKEKLSLLQVFRI